MEEERGKNKYFYKALSNFVQDVSSGGAIRHLADEGYTVDQIAGRLSYPVTKEQIGKTVWKHFVETGVILTEEPSDEPLIEKLTYVKEYGKYGKVHFRGKREWVENPMRSYFLCDFGKMKYQDEENFKNTLKKLWENDRAYILGLTWPLKKVYHVADERMERINEMLSNEKFIKRYKRRITI